MRNDIGRCDHGSNHEREHHKIPTEVFQLFNRDEVEAHQQHHHNGHLKRHAESQVKRQNGFDIRRNVWRGSHTLWREALNEPEHFVEHKELDECNANVGQQAAKDDQRQCKILLVAVKTGGNESPHLVHEPG